MGVEGVKAVVLQHIWFCSLQDIWPCLKTLLVVKTGEKGVLLAVLGYKTAFSSSFSCQSLSEVALQMQTNYINIESH